ncbi:hypothetical protein F5B18DRAFT_630498 [Nemania serpens]|nr:hypothetical protein F5B18DRAFT_630498 [Nemania serpens]
MRHKTFRAKNKDALASIFNPSLAIVNDKSQADEETAKNGHPISVQESITHIQDSITQIQDSITRIQDSITPIQDSIKRIQESSSSRPHSITSLNGDKPSNNEVEQITFEGTTKYEMREDGHAGAQAEKIAEQELQATPISTPPSAVATSRLKYTDIRKEFPPSIPTSNQSTIYGVPAGNNAFPSIAPIDYAPTDPLPIAVFEEQPTPGRRPGGFSALFEFRGWFRISRVNILAPHSAELVCMLEQKWAPRKERVGNVSRAYGWNRWLAAEWAVVRFEPFEGEAAPPPPQIKKAHESEPPVEEAVAETKEVEMMSDMRLSDGNRDEQKDEKLRENTESKSDGDNIAPEVRSGRWWW